MSEDCEEVFYIVFKLCEIAWLLGIVATFLTAEIVENCWNKLCKIFKDDSIIDLINSCCEYEVAEINQKIFV